MNPYALPWALLRFIAAYAITKRNENLSRTLAAEIIISLLRRTCVSRRLCPLKNNSPPDSPTDFLSPRLHPAFPRPVYLPRVDVYQSNYICGQLGRIRAIKRFPDLEDLVAASRVGESIRNVQTRSAKNYLPFTLRKECTKFEQTSVWIQLRTRLFELRKC